MRRFVQRSLFARPPEYPNTNSLRRAGTIPATWFAANSLFLTDCYLFPAVLLSARCRKGSPATCQICYMQLQNGTDHPLPALRIELQIQQLDRSGSAPAAAPGDG